LLTQLEAPLLHAVATLQLITNSVPSQFGHLSNRLPGKFTQLPLRMMTEQVILILLFMFWKLFFHISLVL
jgi:hypothetical protein